MLDENFKNFVKEIGLENVKPIVLNCPEGMDTYSKSEKKYFKRGKQLHYSSDEINVDHLGYICLVLQGVHCGTSFKDKLYEKRAKELIEEIRNGNTRTT